ncbi:MULTISPECIES: hypothetical protein [Acinetobacter calcoaceticus/baumannii complex]|uniref:hypothetical protein n=1 Tax=Acinetobacter calcoaceticus/baumannii complex TaxID=909768 RepID=UPI0004462B30|nr:hypothetical protein [Acinetobacter sp. 1245593]EXH13035.1 hypothetical protein J627_2290 [Acinetobacter sp. 1245593]
MTDLNKEREAFLNTFQYYKGRRDIIFSHEHELFMTRSNNPSDIAQKEISNMNSRWDAWLRCAKHRDAELEKAKAQEVPDQTINEIQSWIAVQSTQAMELDGEAFVVDANELAEFIEQLVKSESGAKR